MDESNELADISVGDAWLKEFKSEKMGESVIVARTGIGLKLLEEASSRGAISLEPIDPLKVRYSQAEPLKFKKVDVWLRLAMLEALGRRVPEFKVKRSAMGNSLASFIRNLFVLFNAKSCDGRFFRKFLTGVPFPIFRLYYGVYKFLSIFG